MVYEKRFEITILFRFPIFWIDLSKNKERWMSIKLIRLFLWAIDEGYEWIRWWFRSYTTSLIISDDTKIAIIKVN